MNSRGQELKFLLKHSAIYGLGNILSRAVAFVLLPLYTRYLSPVDYGVLELIDVTTGLAGIVVGLGVATALSRFYYEIEGDHARGRFVCTVYGLVTLGAGALVAIGHLLASTFASLVLNSEQYTGYFQIAFASLLVGIFIDVGQSYLRMLYKSTLFIALSLGSLVLSVSLNVFFIVHLQLGVLGILYTTLIVRLIVGLPLTAVILHGTGLGFSWRDARALLSYSLPLLPSTLAQALFNYSDRFFIKHYVSIADAGVYGLANKLGGALHLLVTGPFIMTFTPRRFQIAQRSNAPEVFCAVFDAFVLVLVFLSLALALFTDEIMVVMTTPAFYRAGSLVPLILVVMLVFGLKYHVDFGILYSKKTQYYMYINLMTSCVHLSAAWILVKTFGIWGAVYAALLAVSVNTGLLWVVSSRLYRIRFNVSRNVRLLALAVGVYGVSRFLPTDAWWIRIAVKTGLLCAFLIVLPWVKLVAPGELAQLRDWATSLIRRQVPAPAPS